MLLAGQEVLLLLGDNLNTPKRGHRTRYGLGNLENPSIDEYLFVPDDC